MAIGGFVAAGASTPAGARTLPGRAAGAAADGRVAAQGTIEGLVVDDRGTPMGGAVVSAIGPTAAIAISNRVGRFVLHALPVGRYLLQARVLGRNPSAAQAVIVTARADVQARLALSAKPLVAPAAAEAPQYPILAAGFAPLPVETAATGDGSVGARKTVWLLRHLRRSVLKDATGRMTVAGDSRPADAGGIAGPRLAGLADPFTDWASSLSGQINLLTVGSFNSPQELFSANGLSHGVADLAIHSAAGAGGAWTVRGAMTQGEFASWVLSGGYVARLGDHHRYEVGMFYGTQQRPDRSTALAVSALDPIGEGVRSIGDLRASDEWTLSRRVTLSYGADYIRDDYVDSRGLLDPHATVTVMPGRGLRIRAAAVRRSLVPGADELLLPTAEGIWLPPQYAFATLPNAGLLQPERTQRYSVSVEHDLGRSSTIGVGVFHQQVSHQFVTMFGLGPADPTGLPRYFVADGGAVAASGWTVRVTHALTSRVHGSVDYTVSTAQWTPGATDGLLAAAAPSAVRRGSEQLQDLSTSIETDIPETATHVLMLYRFDTGFAQPGTVGHPGFGYRFDVRVTQGLPFLNFSGTQWEALVAVRNFFRDTAAGGSSYDELLVVRPPKRIIGGLLLRF